MFVRTVWRPLNLYGPTIHDAQFDLDSTWRKDLFALGWSGRNARSDIINGTDGGSSISTQVRVGLIFRDLDLSDLSPMRLNRAQRTEMIPWLCEPIILLYSTLIAPNWLSKNQIRTTWTGWTWTIHERTSERNHKSFPNSYIKKLVKIYYIFILREFFKIVPPCAWSQRF